MLTSVFQGMAPTKVKTINLDASRHRKMRSHGFYDRLKKLPTSATIIELHMYFNAPRNVLITPRSVTLPKPTPWNVENPHDTSYSKWLFHRDTWAEEILKPNDFAAYNSALTPQARWRFEDPLMQWIIPYVAGKDICGPNPAAGVSAVNSVSMYVFEIPETHVIDSKAPANAAGPYELCEGKDGNCFFLCHWQSMTSKQRVKYHARLLTLKKVKE